MTSSKVQKPIVPNRAAMRTMEDFISLVKTKKESDSVESTYYDVPHTMKEIFSVFDQNDSIMTTSLSIVMEKDETVLTLPENLCNKLTSLIILVDPDTKAKDLLDISMLSRCSNLTELSIVGFPNLTNVASINACQKLRKLDLSECSSIRELFLSLPELRELRLCGCTYLFNVLFLIHSAKLRVLDVSHCTMLANILPVGREVLTVQKLDISYCTNIQTKSDTIYALSELSHFNCNHSKMAQETSLAFSKEENKHYHQYHNNGYNIYDLETQISRIKRPTSEEKKPKTSVAVSPGAKLGSSKEPVKIISKEAPSPRSSSRAASPVTERKTGIIPILPMDDTPVIITGSTRRTASRSPTRSNQENTIAFPSESKAMQRSDSKPNSPLVRSLEESSSSMTTQRRSSPAKSTMSSSTKSSSPAMSSSPAKSTMSSSTKSSSSKEDEEEEEEEDEEEEGDAEEED